MAKHPLFTVNYFDPLHGGRPPSDEAVKMATARYLAADEVERMTKRRAELDKQDKRLREMAERLSRFPPDYHTYNESHRIWKD